MTAQLLDGNACSAKIKKNVAQAILERQQKGLTTPGLDVILVGENPASMSYVGHKERACKEVGIRSRIHRLPSTVSQNDLASKINQLNDDRSVHGILLQLPLPESLETDDLLERIQPEKDVDGFHPYNLGRLAQKRPVLRPCTPYGVMTLLKETPAPIEGKHAVIVGASNIVGRPMALELLLARCTVTVCHSRTQQLDQHVGSADILVVATGQYDLVKSEWIKPGAIVIDVGFSRLKNGKISGDLDFEPAAKRASWITPVPGGVGPMTVATLMANTLQAATYFD